MPGRLQPDKLLKLVKYAQTLPTKEKLEELLRQGVIAAEQSMESLKTARTTGGVDMGETPKWVTDTLVKRGDNFKTLYD